MARKLYAHNSFVGGQVDRELLGKVSNAMSYSRNTVSSLKGEIRPRTGTRLLMNLTNNSVIVPFRKNGNDIVGLIDNTNVRLFDFTGDEFTPLQNGATPTELVQTWTGNTTNGYTVGMNRGLSGSTQSANAYKAFMPANGGLWDWTPNSFMNNGTVGWFTFAIDPTKNEMINKFNVSFRSFGLTNDYDKWWAYRNANLQYSDDDGHTWIPIRTTQQNYREIMITGTVIINGKTYGRTWEISFDLVSNDSTPHRLYRIWFLPETFIRPSSYPDHVVRVRTYLQDASLQPFEKELQLTDEQLENIKFSQFENKMYLTTFPQITPQLLSQANNFFTMVDYNPSTPANFWELNGLPSCVRHFQGRLVFGGYNNFPARITGSKFLDETNFQVVSSNATPADPIDATCNELKNQIQNIWGGVNALYAMSEDGVAMIDAQGGVISPGNINFRLKNAVPAHSMTPTVKDDVMLYLSADRKRIYIVEYDWNLQRYNVNDITTNVQDYLKDEVSELHFIEDKARMIYGVLRNGGWFALLFDKTAGVVSIFPFDTDGKVRDIAAIKRGNEYKLLMVIERERGLTLEEKLPDEQLQHTYFETDTEAQSFSTEKIMSSFYMDMLQHVQIDGNGLPNEIVFDADALTITSTNDNQAVYDLGLQTGCEVYFYNQETQQSLHIRLNGAVDGQTNVFSVFLLDDSQIKESATFSAWIKAQTKYIPVLEPDLKEFEIVADGQYLDVGIVQNNLLVLPKPLWNIYFGLAYKKIAVITEIGNPINTKLWGTVGLVVQDTLHLEVGARPDKLEKLIEYKPTDSKYNVIPRMTSGGIAKNIPDTEDRVKNLVLYSGKALPFCVVGLVADGTISDMGGN